MDKELEAIYQGVLKGDIEIVRDKVQAALDQNLAAEGLLHEALIPAMAEVGGLFEAGEYFVPEMLIAARAMKGGLEILKPLLVEADIKPAGKVVAGTVKGDLHDIGKNLVCMMLEGAGFEIIDLGTDVDPERIVDIVKDEGVDIVAMSALLTTTMPKMEETITALQDAGLRDRVKVMIGGAPVTSAYAEEIKADGYAPDASQATSLAKKLAG